MIIDDPHQCLQCTAPIDRYGFCCTFCRWSYGYTNPDTDHMDDMIGDDDIRDSRDVYDHPEDTQ